jgi:hypothetical protein
MIAFMRSWHHANLPGSICRVLVSQFICVKNKMRWDTAYHFDSVSEKVENLFFGHFGSLVLYRDSAAGFYTRIALQNFIDCLLD